MKNIKVINIKGKAKGTYHYIGRGSVLGNPFVIGKDGTREEVIQLYKRHLWESIKSHDGGVFREINLLALTYHNTDLTLGCFCYPKECHGDVIKACIIWAHRELTTKLSNA